MDDRHLLCILVALDQHSEHIRAAMSDEIVPSSLDESLERAREIVDAIGRPPHPADFGPG